MDTLDTLLAFSNGDSRMDTLESLYNYSREETSMCLMQQKPKGSCVTSASRNDKEEKEQNEIKPSAPADENRDESIPEYSELSKLGGGVLTRVTDNLACCTKNIRVSDYMDEAFLEDDFYELVYRPSRRPGALHNALASTPSYDEGLIKPILSNITEADEKTVYTLETTKTKDLSKKDFSSLYSDYASWSRLFCSDL